MKPHLSRYWLHTKETDPVVFQRQVEVVCQTYADALDNHEQGIHTISTDEMFGIQALQRLLTLSTTSIAFWLNSSSKPTPAVHLLLN